MPPGQLSGQLPCLSREKRPPPVSTSVKAFRHFIDGSLALAFPDHTCRNLVPAFLQRSPQPLLTAAACSGLRPAPDCRPRGAHPHLLHSTTSPYPGDVFVTHNASALSVTGGVEFVDDHSAPFQSGSIPHAPGNNVSSRDRDFRPTRRRGFDDDNFESPRHSFGSPFSAQR